MGRDADGETETVDQFLDSTLDSVDRAEATALGFAERAGFDEDELHKIAMAVRECLVNAVAHGNRYSANKKVHVTVSRTPEKFAMIIRDEGEGFELSDLPDPLAEENLLRNSGRGIFLIRAFMDEFQIRRVDGSGTEVTLVKYLGSK